MTSTDDLLAGATETAAMIAAHFPTGDQLAERLSEVFAGPTLPEVEAHIRWVFGIPDPGLVGVEQPY